MFCSSRKPLPRRSGCLECVAPAGKAFVVVEGVVVVRGDAFPIPAARGKLPFLIPVPVTVRLVPRNASPLLPSNPRWGPVVKGRFGRAGQTREGPLPGLWGLPGHPGRLLQMWRDALAARQRSPRMPNNGWPTENRMGRAVCRGMASVVRRQKDARASRDASSVGLRLSAGPIR
jgi:hypothetical protein